MSGSNLANQYGVYSTKGIPNSTNIPGGRSAGICWFYNHNFWLFGGSGYSATSLGDLNGDCIVDMKDLGILADNWLSNYTLTDFKQVSDNWYKQSNPD